MNVNGIGATGYPQKGYETKKTEKSAAGGNFAQQVAKAARAAAQPPVAVLHGSDEETGDIAVLAHANLINDSSLTVYKTQDFDPANPVYKVKIWDKDGNITERMVDVSKVDPTNCDTVDMYAYAGYLADSGKGSFEDTVLKVGIASSIGQGDDSSYSHFTKLNWVDIAKNIMQQQYNFGNLKGYMEWKLFLGLLEK